MRLHDILDYRAREHPQREFAYHAGRRLSYGGAVGQANAIANALIAAGLDVGDRVAVLSRNSLEFAVLYFGASKAGAVLVPLNFRLTPPEWGYVLNDAGARVLVVAEEFVGAIESIRLELVTVEWVLVVGVGAPSTFQNYHAWVESASTRAPECAVADNDIVYQMYTSGTTGRPKGVLLSQRAVTSSIFQRTVALRESPADRCLVVAPIFHAAGAMTMFWAISGGGSLILHDAFDPAAVVAALGRERIGRATLVPSMLLGCLAVPDVTNYRYEDLRLISYGGSPISEQTLKRAIEVFGCAFAQGYGLTEATGNVTGLLPSDHQRALHEAPRLLLSAGRPLPGTEIRIVDDEDRPVPDGTSGEIVVRGPQLMHGYWRRPEESADALRGGWLHTGDVGTIDEEGYLYIQDRVKDVIVSGGENVYPKIVEAALSEHPAVLECAVIGVPDEKWGETVKAIVVRRDGADVTAEELIAFCRMKLGGLQRPRSIEFRAVLPRNASGKILKRELREPYWHGFDRRIGGV